MKIRCTEEQGYYRLEQMQVTSGKIYEVQPSNFFGSLVVLDDTGRPVYLRPDEYEILEDE